MSIIFKLIKSEGIAHHSYFLGANGRAVIIDPRRDIDIYLKLAGKHDLEIIHVFETHRNEDYVIGSLELREATGSEIYHGKNLEFGYGNPVSERDKFQIGNMELELLETPGHTLESISLVLRDLSVSRDAQMVFTGDVIFSGETGRIDFYGLENREKMAGLLYDSIYQKILPLGNQTVLCPAHGAGSVCGADIREQDYTTIGYELQTNPSLQFKNKEDFLKYKVSELLYTPPYFKRMEEYNQNGAPLLCRLPVMKPIPTVSLKNMKSNDVQILDVRKPTSFGGGHIPGSLSIWREGVAAFAGWFLNYHDPIILVDDHENALNEVHNSLVRLGYDNIYGYLSGGFPSWYLHAEGIETLNLWTVKELREHQFDGDFFLLDVRKIDDWDKGYIEGAHHIYVGHVPEKLGDIPRDIPVVVYCDSGYKSTIAASILQKNGYENVVSVLGSMNAWKKARYPVVSA